MLTAADVEQKTFSTALRGYDLDEVDDFLDEIVATIRDLNDQLEEAKKGSTAAPAPVAAPAPEPEPEPEKPAAEAPAPVIDESAVGRALIAAQTAADQLLVDARSEATQIVDNAKSEADTWEAEREAKRVEAEAEIASISNRVSSVKAELSVLADEVSVKLEDMDAVIAGRHSTSDSSADDGGADSGGDVLEFGSPSDDVDDVPDGEVEEDETETGNAGHLDDILNGVAADLQLDSEGSDEPTPDDYESTDDSDYDPDEDE
jgi:DivIVA domain-containing protein